MRSGWQGMEWRRFLQRDDFDEGERGLGVMVVLYDD